jgi:hypothetical protein
MVAAATIGAAVIGGGASANAANKSAKAQKNAASANNSLAEKQLAEDTRRYEQNRADQERWGMMQINGEERMYQETQERNRGMMDRGETAGNQLAYRMGLGGNGTGKAGGLNDRYKDFNFNFEADPSYAFQREEGLRGIGNQFAASGSSLSGAALKAMQRFGTGLADQSYGTSYNRARSGYETDRAAFSADNTNEYNRLMGVQGVGQNAVNSVSGIAANAQGQISDAYKGIASGQQNVSNQLGQSQANYYNNLMSNNNASANATAAYNNAFGNALGGGLGSLAGAWNSYQKNNNQSAYPTQNSGGYSYLDF